VNKLKNLNVGYMKIPKTHRGPPGADPGVGDRPP